MLQNLGETLWTDRSYLFFLKKGLLYNTHEWCATGVTPQKENLQGMSPNLLARWMEIFRHNQCVTVFDVETVRALDKIEYRIMNEQGIKRACNTALIAPFSSPNRPFYRKIWEKGRTYPIVMQNALCLPALKHMTRFADAKSRS